MMNRTIKFRAWNKKLGMSKNVISVNLNDSGIPNCVAIFSKGAFAWDVYGGNDSELMQFTGLKDKRGKEIYEGDIIQVEGAIPAEIYWEYEAWQLRNGDKTGGMLGNWESEQIEVIGNIYENPNLLTPNTAGREGK